MVRTLCSHCQGPRIQSLVRELKFHNHLGIIIRRAQESVFLIGRSCLGALLPLTLMGPSYRVL